MTAELALFDVADLPTPTRCTWCPNPATTRLNWSPNLATWTHDPSRSIYPTWDALTRATSRRPLAGGSITGCETCTWIAACAYWGGNLTCPRGRCVMWAHTWEQPAYDCGEHHWEREVVWRERLPGVEAAPARPRLPLSGPRVVDVPTGGRL